MKQKKCKILVPIYQPKISHAAQISLSHIRKYLSRYEICFISPDSLDISAIILNKESIERFPDTFFVGIKGYNSLLKSTEFYRRFESYDYILIAQLDCLIFRDELEEWVNAGWDYIAAPWFKGFAQDHGPGLWRVGNGGLSLRKVESHLRVLQQLVTAGSIYPRWGHYAWKPPMEFLEAGMYKKISGLYGLNPLAKKHTVEEELNQFPYNEDVFWGIEARKFDSDFQVSGAEEALHFCFEVSPRWCFEKTSGRLPFGCHAWTRYDRDFWEEVLSHGRGLI